MNQKAYLTVGRVSTAYVCLFSIFTNWMSVFQFAAEGRRNEGSHPDYEGTIEDQKNWVYLKFSGNTLSVKVVEKPKPE